MLVAGTTPATSILDGPLTPGAAADKGSKRPKASTEEN
jgi:hypothetical protein